jgi:hypothetical protein
LVLAIVLEQSMPVSQRGVLNTPSVTQRVQFLAIIGDIEPKLVLAIMLDRFMLIVQSSGFDLAQCVACADRVVVVVPSELIHAPFCPKPPVIM